jgi:DNA-binding MarR family transcriptional regulator
MEAPLDDVLEFMGLIWAIDHEMERVSKRMEATIGLTIPQRMSLLLIGQCPGMLASDLARILHLHRGTLTGIIQRLESAGFVKRTIDSSDSRRVGLSVTPAGRRMNELRTGTFEAAVRHVLASAARDELSAASQVLTMLAAELRATAGFSAH